MAVGDKSSSTSTVTSGVSQGTLLRPALFLVYLNDIADNLNSIVRLFADDCVIYRAIKSEQDHHILREDFNTWQMNFNIYKRAIV